MEKNNISPDHHKHDEHGHMIHHDGKNNVDDHKNHHDMDHQKLGDNSTHGDETFPEDHSNHTDHSNHEEMFKQKFFVSFLIAIPVLLYSSVVQGWLGFTMPSFFGSNWIVPIFSIAIFLYGGIPFIKMAIPEFKNNRPGMMALISLAISVSFIYSVLTTIFNIGESFYWELVTLILVMLLGHWIEMRSVRQASGALDELAKLLPDTAERINKDGSYELITINQLIENDLVLVRPGESIPIDGIVEEGESKVNESMVTGESKLVDKTKGVPVIGGTINGDGSLRIKVINIENESMLAGIMRLVEEAQNSKSKTQLLADKAAGWLFYGAIFTAFLTGLVWTINLGLEIETLKRVVTVLVIACPHALGLAVPLVIANSTSIGAKNGILVKDRIALELIRNIDIVVFDKTGTLTEGNFGLIDIETADGWSDDDALALASAIEGDSEHLIAKSIREAANARNLIIPIVTKFQALKGVGAQGEAHGDIIHIGGPKLIEKFDINLSQSINQFKKDAGLKGRSVIYLLINKDVIAAFSLADVIKKESKQVIDKLSKLGIEAVMLTGDSEDVAKAVAEDLGMNQYYSQVLPKDKDEKIIELQKSGKEVAMVGDGINDAPALSRADVGIAIGNGTDVAIESAGIILLKNNPMDVVKAIQLSKATHKKMIENLWWATGYNVIAIPVAAGVLAPWGIFLSPAVGAIFMSLSTIVVAINAQLLRNLKFE